MITQEPRENPIGLIMRKDTSSKREVLGMRAFRDKRLDKHVHEIRLGARLHLAFVRDLPLDRSNLVRQPEQIKPANIPRRDERNRRARFPSTSRSSRPMHVRFRVLRKVVVDDMRQQRNINPA